MWHIKTKLGTFWIVQGEDQTQKYYLGHDDEDLGEYESIEKALDDVCNQETGYLKWDELQKVSAPHDIEEWQEGAPEGW